MNGAPGRWWRVTARTKVLMGVALVLYLLNVLSPRPFSASEWKAFHSNYRGMGISPPDDIRRARMVDSLRKSHLRVGMTPTEGRILLGTPETEGGDGSSQDDGYALTYSPLFWLPGILLRWGRVNPYLYVRYENGKLVRTEVQ